MNRRNAVLAAALAALVTLAASPLAAAPPAGEKPGGEASAYMANAANARAEMKKLEFLHGQWEGPATYERGPNGKMEIRQTETVEPKLGGAVLLVQGKGFMKDPAGGADRVVFEALAIVSPDPKGGPGTYRFRTFLPDGRYADADAKLVDGKIVWGHPDPRTGGGVRYTTTVADGRWNEIGENVKDGEPAVKFFEMNVTKK